MADDRFPIGSGIVSGSNLTLPSGFGNAADGPFPVGSGILRIRDVGDTGGGFDPTCVNSRYVVDNFTTHPLNRPYQQSLTSTGNVAWFFPSSTGNGSWEFDITGLQTPLTFPGSNLGGGKHKISPDFLDQFSSATGGSIRVVFTSAPSVPGTLYITTSQFNGYSNPRVGVVYQFANYGYGGQYIRFDAADGLFHPELSGAGYITVSEQAVGGAGDATTIGSLMSPTWSEGALSQLSNGSWGVRLLEYSSPNSDPPVTSVANRDYVLMRWRFKFNRLATTKSQVSLRVGNIQFDVAPAAAYSTGNRGLLRLTSTAESVEIPRTDLVPDTYYNAEIDVRLPEGIARARIYADGSMANDWIEVATAGERWGQVGYHPTIGIWTLNADSLLWTLIFDQIEADIADSGDFSNVGGSVNSSLIYREISGQDAWGASKSWHTEDPNDGRAYAVAWSDGSETRGGVGSPSLGASMVWGLFGDWGGGILLSYTNNVASIPVPATESALLGGGPFNLDNYEVRIWGEVGFKLSGQDTGIGANYMACTVAIKSYAFGTGGVYWYDYSALGIARQYVALSGGIYDPTMWRPFDVTFDADTSNGLYDPTQIQWGLEVAGGGVEELRGAGPLAGGFFLPNWGGFGVSVRNVRISLRRRGDWSSPFPCAPPKAGETVVVTG